jgi:hypothetical protein
MTTRATPLRAATLPSFPAALFELRGRLLHRVKRVRIGGATVGAHRDPQFLRRDRQRIEQFPEALPDSE